MELHRAFFVFINVLQINCFYLSSNRKPRHIRGLIKYKYIEINLKLHDLHQRLEFHKSILYFILSCTDFFFFFFAFDIANFVTIRTRLFCLDEKQKKNQSTTSKQKRKANIELTKSSEQRVESNAGSNRSIN